jgi:hypothetical protein
VSTSAILRVRRDTAADWTSNNPTPEDGQLCFETDTKLFKLGDGATAWTSLAYVLPYFAATDKLLGRATAGAGPAEAIACTAAGRALLDDAAASNQRTTLGFGTDLLRDSLCFLASPTAGVTLSTVALAAAFLGKSSRNIQEFDATDFTQVRLTVRVTTAGVSGTQLRVLYRTVADGFSTTLGDHVSIGTSDVTASIDTAGIRTTSWTDLASGAKAPIYITIEQSGGNGSTPDPVLAFIQIQFRRR